MDSEGSLGSSGFLYYLLGLLVLSPMVLPSSVLAMGATALAYPMTPVVYAKFFAAGGICCCVSHSVAVPLDVVKTRQQSDPARYSDPETGKPLGIVGTVLQIVREEGAGMLLQGLGSTLVGYLIQGAFKYGLWEVFKATLGFGAAEGVVRVLILVGAAFAAEMVASTLLCPFERARIRLVADPGFAEGLLPALSRLAREEGVVQGLFGDGLAPTLVKMTAYTTAQLTTFTLVSEALSGALPPDVPRLAFTIPSSLIAGFVASIASQPGDTLQTCTSSRLKLSGECPVDVDTVAAPSLFDIAQKLGPGGLFTGWQARLVQMEVIVVTQLLVYDTIKSAVGL